MADRRVIVAIDGPADAGQTQWPSWWPRNSIEFVEDEPEEELKPNK
jgi:hypothetical protein